MALNRTMKSKRWLLNLIFVAIGLGMLGIAGWLAAPTRDFVRSSIMVPGKVVANELDRTRGKHSGGYYTIFTFTDPATHKQYTIRDDMKHNPSLYGSGDAITALYPPASPEEARIECFRSLWEGPAVVAGGGGAILLFGLIITVVDFCRRPVVKG